MESISKIQQLLAESKFVEAQREAEIIFNQVRGSDSIELLELYFEALKAQSRPLPHELLFNLIDKLLPQHPDEAHVWLNSIAKTDFKDKQRILLIEIKIADLKGKTEELYKLISQFQIMRFQTRTPNIPLAVRELSKKHFPHDFHIQLQRLAIELLKNDLVSCEKMIQELILSCFEKSSPKGTKEKLNSLYEVLNATENLYHLELYKNLCLLVANGTKEKKDLKKIIEFIIYFEDFKFQVLVLDLLVKEDMEEAAKKYAQEIRTNKNYNYVYLDKFLPHLKPLFFSRTETIKKPAAPVLHEMDLKVGKVPQYPFYEEILSEVSEEEILLSHLLKHQEFSTNELLDIAVSFFQSEYFLAALKASELAIASTDKNEFKLRASYLKVTCLLKTGDCRAALDVSLNALRISETQNDILSFLYSQAEAHQRLKEYKEAKTVLKRILSIDSSYRLAKERLERLNAI